MTTKPELPDHIQTALIVILNYLYAEEQRHYEEEQTVSHIFHSLRSVAEWMEYEPE